MSDNYQIRDANGALVTIKSKDVGGGVQMPQAVSSDSTGTPYDSSNPLPLYVPGYAGNPSGSFTRPADVTPYALGDLVANNVTAGSVVPLSFANAVRASGGVGRIERVRLDKTGTSIVNAQFRAHFYSAAPSTVANGDNGAWLTAKANYLGAFDVTVDRVFSDGASGSGVSLSFNPMTYQLPSGTTLYALLEARAAYTPISGEIFTLTLENFRF